MLFRPRSIEDWGTKFNITSEMMMKGIAELKARGTKVHLSYGAAVMALVPEEVGDGRRHLLKSHRQKI